LSGPGALPRPARLRVIGAITIRLGNCKGPSRNGEKMSMLIIAGRFYRKIAWFLALPTRLAAPQGGTVNNGGATTPK
jgi:hypothetical protein